MLLAAVSMAVMLIENGWSGNSGLNWRWLRNTITGTNTFSETSTAQFLNINVKKSRACML
jgi:hypothetical protein